MDPPCSTEALLRHFFDLVNDRDAAALAELLDPEARFDFPKAPAMEGRDRIVKFLKLLWRRFPRLQFDVLDVIVGENGERAAVHWRNVGEDRQGEPYHNEGVTWLLIRGDRLLVMSDFFKDTGKF